METRERNGAVRRNRKFVSDILENERCFSTVGVGLLCRSSYFESCWICIAPRSFVTLNPSGVSKGAFRGGDPTTLHPTAACSSCLCSSTTPPTLSASFLSRWGVTSREKATYHPPAVIRWLAKPFSTRRDVTRDVNWRQETAAGEEIKKRK